MSQTQWVERGGSFGEPPVRSGRQCRSGVVGPRVPGYQKLSTLDTTPEATLRVGRPAVCVSPTAEEPSPPEG